MSEKLPGNGHATDAEKWMDISPDMATAHAILALAFEQRTANLIAMHQVSREQGAGRFQDTFTADIDKRLGMEQ